MIEVRFRGIGGQGLVVAARILADAGAKGGYQTQSFASYGGGIRRDYVEGYLRISEEKLVIHSKVDEPDCLFLAEESYANEPALLLGLKEQGWLVINSPKPPKSFSSVGNYKIYTIDANQIARNHGIALPSGMPPINTVIMGAIAGLIPLIDMEYLAEAIREGGIPSPEKNIKAAQEAYRRIKLQTLGTVVTEVTEGAPEAAIKGERFPEYHLDKMPRCNRCLICYIFCPDLAITFTTEPFSFTMNRNLCKACGICIEECPRKAISWEEVEL